MTTSLLGHTYATVESGVLARFFTADDTPEWDQADTPGAAGTYAVDVTFSRPQPQLGWPWDGTKFTPPARTLQDRQGDAWLNIKQRREQSKAGGVQIGSNWFQTDDASRIQYLGLKDSGRDLLAAGGAMTDVIYENGAPVDWKTYANSFVPMTVQLAFDLVAAVKTLDAAAFKNAEVHRLTMLQVAVPETYDYSTGWPPAAS